MKFKTTQKQIKTNYTVIKVPYCGLQTLLRYRSPIAYTTRVEGWASDVYDLGYGVAVSTGYQPFGGDFGLDFQAIEKEAEGKTRDEVDQIINSLVDKIMKEYL